MSDINASLLAAFFILQVLDIYTTYTVLNQGPEYREANPILAKLFEKFSVISVLIPLKLVAILVMALLASSDDILVTALLIIANVVYLVIVCHNFDNIE